MTYVNTDVPTGVDDTSAVLYNRRNKNISIGSVDPSGTVPWRDTRLSGTGSKMMQIKKGEIIMKEKNGQGLFKTIMGNYPTGVTIITTKTKEGKPVGLTVNSFASVSLEPLMVLWSIDHGSSSLKEFTDGGKFAVHVLSEDQTKLCRAFASKDVDRFGSCEWNMSKNGLPIIEGTFGVMECKTFNAIEAGDHTVLIGEVTDLIVNEGKDPMLYHRRVFGPIPKEFYSQEQPVS